MIPSVTEVVVVGQTDEEDHPVIAELRRIREDVIVECRPLYPAQLTDIFRQASYVIVTSKSESFGYSFLEALACGVPVVCFAQDDGARQSLPLFNLGAWGSAEALQAFPHVLQNITSEVMAERLSEAEVVRQVFSWDRLIDRYLSVYSKAIAHSLLSGRTRNW
jgi:glycosyltransferase involved in cell wall biosynthesis